MFKNNALFDDMAKLAGGAAGSLLEMRKELEAMVQAKIDVYAAKAQLVTREEFEVVQEVALKARAENEQLQARIAELEGKCSK